MKRIEMPYSLKAFPSKFDAGRVSFRDDLVQALAQSGKDDPIPLRQARGRRRLSL